MTMQIGMVGSDGIVVASDTRWTHEPKNLTSAQIGRAVRFGTNGIKIKVSMTQQVAVSFAADRPSAASMADELLAKLSADASPDAMAIFQEAFDAIPTRERNNVQGFIVLTRPALQLFRFEVGRKNRKWLASCEPVFGYGIAGDLTNPAVFWAERYHQENLPLERLIPLAAHLVISSHFLNTAGIGGLEMVECDIAGVRLVKREQIKELKDKSTAWDRRIGEIVCGPDTSP